MLRHEYNNNISPPYRFSSSHCTSGRLRPRYPKFKYRRSSSSCPRRCAGGAGWGQRRAGRSSLWLSLSSKTLSSTNSARAGASSRKPLCRTSVRGHEGCSGKAPQLHASDFSLCRTPPCKGKGVRGLTQPKVVLPPNIVRVKMQHRIVSGGVRIQHRVLVHFE